MFSIQILTHEMQIKSRPHQVTHPTQNYTLEMLEIISLLESHEIIGILDVVFFSFVIICIFKICSILHSLFLSNRGSFFRIAQQIVWSYGCLFVCV